MGSPFSKLFDWTRESANGVIAKPSYEIALDPRVGHYYRDFNGPILFYVQRSKGKLHWFLMIKPAKEDIESVRVELRLSHGTGWYIKVFMHPDFEMPKATVSQHSWTFDSALVALVRLCAFRFGTYFLLGRHCLWFIKKLISDMRSPEDRWVEAVRVLGAGAGDQFCVTLNGKQTMPVSTSATDKIFEELLTATYPGSGVRVVGQAGKSHWEVSFDSNYIAGLGLKAGKPVLSGHGTATFTPGCCVVVCVVAQKGHECKGVEVAHKLGINLVELANTKQLPPPETANGGFDDAVTTKTRATVPTDWCSLSECRAHTAQSLIVTDAPIEDVCSREGFL